MHRADRGGARMVEGRGGGHHPITALTGSRSKCWRLCTLAAALASASVTVLRDHEQSEHQQKETRMSGRGESLDGVLANPGFKRASQVWRFGGPVAWS